MTTTPSSPASAKKPTTRSIPGLHRPLRITTVSAGLSTPSSTDLLARSLNEAVTSIAAHNGAAVEITHIDVKSLAYRMMDVLVTGLPNDDVDAALAAMENADGIALVTPIYAGSYSGLFKTFMDLVGTDRIRRTPILLAATGGSARHSLALDHALRPLAGALRAHPIPTGVFAATADFGEAGTDLDARIQRAAAELVQHTLAHVLSPRLEMPAHTDGAAPAAPPAATPTTQEVGAPGRGAQAPALNADGTKGTLSPTLSDFVPMEDYFSAHRPQ
ncbi:oxidoreductase [Corynebacterium sp. 13CS0277]|uniref:CE1759 family FMN reductase n=1 Tax=Corynebacterium sp. 13CS0277 TaxID=2071994 RepID=UPI000D02EF45|nr:CE1759 family FMN reductase [Corynebacterium sp. 13CS0277]PRQ12487.1 oxidoreductase [Corynebacterium sp. 13CS0277]